MECVIFIGPQASGKSTFYRERFFRSHVRINLDMLKTRHREWRFLQTCLETRQPFVIDNTNPRRTDRARYIDPAREAGFTIAGYLFAARIDDILQRNAQRPEDEQVPERGIRGTLARLEQPIVAEGFRTLYRVRLAPPGFAVEPWPDPD